MKRKTILNDLAGYLEGKRQAILTQFVVGVQVDPAITTTDTWNRGDIEGHLSRLIGDLISALRAPGDSGPVNDALESAVAHGAHRWEQEYKQSELLNEFAVFRDVLMFHIARFEDDFPNIDMQTRLDIEYTVHRFLDQLMVQGAGRFADLVASRPTVSAPNLGSRPTS